MPAPKSIAEIVAYIPDLDLPLDLISASITLDKSRAPYAEADLLVHLPGESDLEQIDPRDGLRVQLTAELEWAEPTKANQIRTFDFLLHAREVNQEEATLRLTLESDEALLIDYMRIGSTADTSAEPVGGSLRAVINTVLDDFGAALEPGTDDANFTITSNATNLNTNPTLEVDATGYAVITGGTGNTFTATRVLTGGHNSTAGWRLTASAVNTSVGRAMLGAPIVVTAGQVISISYWVRCPDAVTITPAVALFTAADGTGTETADSAASVALVAGVYKQFTHTITVPVGVLSIRPSIRFPASSTVASRQFFFDEVTVVIGATPLDFNGATVDANYTYAWTGTAHASTSTRTRLDSRSPDLLKWQPGVTAWEFLDPLIRTSGLRLFCDEERDWYLVDAAAFLVDGVTSVSAGNNAVSGTDTISLQSTQPDGSPAWYSGVQVIYRWTDAAGVQQTAYDYAGTGDKGYAITLDRAYPGPGLAASRLAAAAGRGRTQELEALADLNTSPGQTLVSTLPGTPVQLGIVSAVTWAWSADGDAHDLMTIRSEGLQDTPANAWFFALGAWSAATGSWAAATGTN